MPDQSSNVPLLSDCVQLFTNHGLLECTLNLTPTELSYHFSKRNDDSKPSNWKAKTIAVDDIIGCEVQKSRAPTSADAVIHVIAYPIKNSQRKRKSLQFVVNRHQSFQQNSEEALKWRNAIRRLNDGDRDRDERKFLFIINPASGRQRAMRIFKRHVKPLLADSGVTYELRVTQYAHQAMQMVRDMDDISIYSAIVVVSGDGLLYEVVNGLASRKDMPLTARTAIPLGIIPGGSGNGLAHTINQAFTNGAKSVDPVFDCTLHVTRGKSVAMDLTRVTTPYHTYYSFLSVGWGLLADIDIESERLRLIGEPRFTIWAIYRSLVFRKYHGILSYVPIESQPSTAPIPALGSPLSAEWVTIEDDFVQIYSAYQTHISSSIKFAPDSKLDDGIIWLLFIRGNITRKQCIQFLLAMEKGKHTKLEFVTYLPVRAFRLEPTNNVGRVTIDGELIESSPIQVQIMPRMANILTR